MSLKVELVAEACASLGRSPTPYDGIALFPMDDHGREVGGYSYFIKE